MQLDEQGVIGPLEPLQSELRSRRVMSGERGKAAPFHVDGMAHDEVAISRRVARIGPPVLRVCSFTNG